MKYIVYLTTNKVNNHIYIGYHGQENPEKFDGYIGNGINIFKSNSELKYPKLPFHRAVKKYGYNAFLRITLKEFDNSEDALAFEAMIVDKQFIQRKDTYNITCGGNIPPVHSKTVHLYDLEGNYLKTWNSFAEVNNFYNSNVNLGFAIKYKYASLDSFWSCELYETLDTTEYSIYRSAQEVYLYDSQGLYIRTYESLQECAKDFSTYLSKVQRAVKLGNPIDGYYLSSTMHARFQKPIIPPTEGPIHQYSLEGKYLMTFNENTIKDLDFDLSCINRAIKEDTTYKGYQWIRGEKLKKLTSKAYIAPSQRAIIQLDLDGNYIREFATVREARKQFPNVSRVLKGHATHCHGYTFIYKKIS